MQHVVLATAGHIDHGKSELCRALTGIETDKLPEEKSRGITIDLGFAHLDLADRRVAFIDVPGHERFVRNMLAGVGGIDLALLVVAADESVMPQTREHVQILELLQVERGVIALTKTDLVDDEMLELVRLEVQELVEGTFLETAPVEPVSSKTGAGLDRLRDVLAASVGAVAARDDTGPFRMHVDRAFSVRGFGSVATGTVWSGAASVGDELELVPGGKVGKVRGIQVHGADADRAAAGSRAALNLSGVELGELHRGCQLVPPGMFAPRSLIDVELRLLADSKPLTELSRVHLHVGSMEVLARVKLLGLDGAPLEPGGRCYAQLRVEAPLLTWPGDRFIIRRYSPVTTIGGGVVLDLPQQKHRGAGERAARSLENFGALDGVARIEQLIEGAGSRGLTVADLVERTGRLAEELDAQLAASDGLVTVRSTPKRLFARGAWQALGDRALAVLAEFHAREPLRDGMSREELRARVKTEATSARQLIDELAASGKVRLLGDRVASAEHRVELDAAQTELSKTLEAAFRAGGLAPPSTKDVLKKVGAGKTAEELLAVLVRQGRLVAVPGGMHYHAEVIEQLKRDLLAQAGEGAELTVARFKELSGTTRKHAIPLLEYLDTSRFTRRRGDVRVIVG